MAESRVFAPREVVWAVPELGVCQLRSPTAAVERVLSSYYADPDADATAFVDALLSHTLIAPRLSYDDVRALPLDARAALRIAVAEAANLPPVEDAVARPAASDETLLTAMRARFERATGNLRRALDPARLLFVPAQPFIDAVQDAQARIHAALRGRDAVQILGEWLDRLREIGEYAEVFITFIEAEPLGFLILEMDAGEGFELLIDAETQGDHVVADAVERALIQDDDFIARVGAAVESASSLDAVHKEELGEAVDALRAGKPWSVPCGMLLGGVEGMLWHAADQEGVIDDKRNLVKTARGPRRDMRHARNVNQLLHERDGFDRLDQHLRLFLDDALYDGHGHGLRHRRARTKHREYSCWGLIGLCGWLDRTEGTGLMERAGERLDAALAGRGGNGDRPLATTTSASASAS